MTLDCRKAQMLDAELLWRWANDPETRQNAFSTAPIPYAEHLAWLEGRLRSEATSIWIFSHGPAPVGQVRFDLTADLAEISIVVAPEQRGCGYGKAMLTEAVRRVRQLFEAELKDNCKLEVIDVYQQPILARDGQIVATPTLVKEFPLPVRRLIGNLANTARLFVGLDLVTKGTTGR